MSQCYTPPLYVIHFKGGPNSGEAQLMAYLPGLSNDIFISYAHADNSEAWVDQFHERVFNRLRQLDRSAPFTIWRDRKLSGADVFTDESIGSSRLRAF